MLWREGQVVDVLALWDSIRMQADPDRDRVVLAGALLEFLDWLVPR